jgi:mono/diheme cytochrome c family protein
MELFSKVLTNNWSKVFFLPALAIFLFLSLIPNYALSQDKPENHGGHGNHIKNSPQPGSEYQVEKMPMDHHHDDGDGDPFRTRGSHGDLGITKPGAMQEEGLLARGRNIYLHMCVFCHGKDGDGGGTATNYLYPWPRDFRKAIFKFRSTPTETLPRDEDLYRTIIKGVPGTSMPAWEDALSPQDTWALINLIKNFSPRFSNEPQGEKIIINDPPQSTPQLIAKGKELFTKNKCDACHGKSLRGDGKLSESLKDAWSHAVFVHDITSPRYYKAGHEAKDIFRTLSSGLDGTPMSSYAHLPSEDRWALVQYIRSNFTGKIKQAEFETDIFSFRKEFEINTDINSPIWDDVKTTNLVMRPLSARRDAIDVINFASINNGEQIAIRLKWEDPSKNAFSELNQDHYRDGVAVQFALGDATLHTHGHNEPFFGMGNRGKPVNIWHWKSGLEETLEAEGDQEYSGDVDMDALIFGGVMSNPVTKLNLTSENSVEELNAEGFGTITPQPAENQNVEGYGEWKDGVWTVVFLRDMPKVGKWDADLTRKDPAMVALAVWDGVKEDRNGRKVISVWQRLNILDK